MDLFLLIINGNIEGFLEIIISIRISQINSQIKIILYSVIFY